MTRNQLFALAYEVERTLYESSSSWEGIDAQEIPVREKLCSEYNPDLRLLCHCVFIRRR